MINSKAKAVLSESTVHPTNGSSTQPAVCVCDPVQAWMLGHAALSANAGFQGDNIKVRVDFWEVKLDFRLNSGFLDWIFLV